MSAKLSLLNEGEEMATIARAVERSLDEGCGSLAHLSTPIGRASYLLKADIVESLNSRGRRLLDWGCGYGQLSYLLRNRGFEVVAYTIESRAPSLLDSLLREDNLDVVYGDDPVALPFEDESFDIVLSCGVLEHVEDERGSLSEISRILRPEGLFVVMMLPNEWSWAEFMARNVFRASVHDRLYSIDKMSRLISTSGFRTIKTWRSNVLPKNLTPLPEALRQSLGAYPRIWLKADAWLSRIPPFSWFSGVVEGVFLRVK